MIVLRLCDGDLLVLNPDGQAIRIRPDGSTVPANAQDPPIVATAAHRSGVPD